MSGPETPGVLQLDYRTTTSIAVIGNTTDVSGSPFIRAAFAEDTGGVQDRGYVDASNNYPDSSGNGVDGSGNFRFIYTGLQPSTQYNLLWKLENTVQYGNYSQGNNLRTLQVAPVPLTSVENTSSIQVTGSDPSGNYPGWNARFFIFDQYNNPINIDGSGNYIDDSSPDASGNYYAEFTGLSQNTTYKFNYSFNTGDFLSEVSALQSFTTLQDLAGQPDPLELNSKTSTSISVLGYTTNISGSPFISARFYIDGSSSAIIDASNNYPDSSGNGLDGYGNFYFIYTGLKAFTNYEVSWALTNSVGEGPDSSGVVFKTTQVVPVPLTASNVSISSITLTGSDPSDNYIGWTAIFYIYDSSQNPFLIDGSNNYIVDLSGTYSVTFDTSNNLIPYESYFFTYFFQDPSSNDYSEPSQVQLFTLQDPPGQPGLLQLGSKTTSSITVLGYITDVSGSPFTSAIFYLDGSENGVVSEPDKNLDASGNTSYTYTGLESLESYELKWKLTNTAGDGPDSSGVLFETLEVKPEYLIASEIDTTFIILSSKDISGDYIDKPTYFQVYDSSFNTPFYYETDLLFDTSGSSPDNSGNYSKELNVSEDYKVYFVRYNFLDSSFNDYSEYSPYFPFQTAPAPPNDPSGNLIFSHITTNSIRVTVSDPSGIVDHISNLWFPRIFIYDSSGIGFNNYGKDGNENFIDLDESDVDLSGNYYANFNNLISNRLYQFKWCYLRNHVISITNPQGQPNYYRSLMPLSTKSTTNFLSQSTNNIICFLRGSRILCLNDGFKEEYIPIEQMKIGTLVKTLDGSFIKVHSIGSTTFNNPDNADRGPNRLFKLTVQNYPELTEDLIITGCHSRLVDKLLPHQKNRHLKLMKTLYMTTGKFRLMAFIDEKAEPYLSPGNHEIWHFALENKEVLCNYGVYANGGLLVETASIKTMTERGGLVLIE
jgi:hypothetical protein